MPKNPTKTKPKSKPPAKSAAKHPTVANRPVGLGAALEALREQYGRRPLFAAPTRRYVPMRHRALAELLSGASQPGLPTGCYIEIRGNAGSGKTSLTFAMIDAVINQPPASVRRVTDDGTEQVPAPRKVAFIDFERTMDAEYLASAVPNVVIAEADDAGRVRNAAEANVYIAQPDTLEHGVEIMLGLFASGEFGLGVLDSVAAMLPQAEAELSMHADTVGLQSRALGKMFRKATPMLTRFGVTCVLINQWRDKIGVRFGDPRTAPGGKSLDYYDAIQLDVSGPKGTPWFDDGKIVNVKAMKNKVTGLRRECTYHLGDRFGLSAEVELTEMAAAVGLLEIAPNGRTTLRVPGTKNAPSFPTRRAWLAALHGNADLFARLARRVDAAGGKPVVNRREGWAGASE